MEEVKLWANKYILIAMTILGVILSSSIVRLIKNNRDFFPVLVFSIGATLLFTSWLAVFIDLFRVKIHNKRVWFIGILLAPLQPLFVILYLLNREKNMRLYKRFKSI